MVLPAPSAHDQSPEREAHWIRPLRVALRLSKDGVLLLVDHARPERLGELVRALLVRHCDLDVITNAQFIPRLEVGSTVVFLPKAEEGPYLNEIRPLIAQRKLNLILFSDRDTTITLRNSAPDFLDWISNYVECPEGPVAHAVAGLRAAIAANALGIHWTGADDDVGAVWQSISAAFPGEALKWLIPQREYQDTLDEIRSSSEGWIGCRTRAETHVRKFRWALAETGKRGRAILVTSLPAGAGFWPVHNRLLPLSEAAEKLKNAGATHPFGLAAMVDLEPEAIEMACVLLTSGMKHADFVALLAGVEDPGATLAKAMKERGCLDETNAFWPPVLRGMPDRFSAEVAAVEKQAPQELAQLGAWIEGRIRGGLDAQGWAEMAEYAVKLGDNDTAAAWALRSIELTGKILPKVENKWDELTDKGTGKAGYQLLSARLQQWPERRKHLRFMLYAACVQVASCGLGLYLALHNFALAAFLCTTLGTLLGLAVIKTQSTIIRNLRVDAHALKTTHTTAIDNAPISERIDYTQVLKAYLAGDFHHFIEFLNRLRFTNESEFSHEHPRYRATWVLYIVLFNDGIVGFSDDKNSWGFADRFSEAIILEGRLVGVSRASFSELMIELAAVQQRKGDAQGAMALLAKPLASERAAEWLSSTQNVVPAPLPFSDPEAIEYVHLYVAQPEPVEKVRPEIRARALRILAESMLSQGRYEEANLIAEDARTTAEQAGAKLESFRALSIQGRANALAGRYDPEGKTFLQDALALAEKTVGKTHIDTARIMLEYARMAHRHGDPEAADWAKRTTLVYAQIKADVLLEEREEAFAELTRIAGS